MKIFDYLRDAIRFIGELCHNLEPLFDAEPENIKVGMPGETKLIQAQQKVAEGLKEMLEVLGPSLPLRTVNVQDNDTLWSLAKTHLGDGQRWRELYMLNIDQVVTWQDVHRGAPGPDMIYTGQSLRVLQV